MRRLVWHMHDVCAIHVSGIVCTVTLKFLVVWWLGLSVIVRVRVRDRDGKWIFFVPFFFSF